MPFPALFLCILFLAPKLPLSVALFPVALTEMCSQSCSQPAVQAGFGPPRQESVGCVHMFCFSFFGESGGEGFGSPHSASPSWRSKTPESSSSCTFCRSDQTLSFPRPQGQQLLWGTILMAGERRSRSGLCSGQGWSLWAGHCWSLLCAGGQSTLTLAWGTEISSGAAGDFWAAAAANPEMSKAADKGGRVGNSV